MASRSNLIAEVVTAFGLNRVHKGPPTYVARKGKVLAPCILSFCPFAILVI